MFVVLRKLNNVIQPTASRKAVRTLAASSVEKTRDSRTPIQEHLVVVCKNIDLTHQVTDVSEQITSTFQSVFGMLIYFTCQHGS